MHSSRRVATALVATLTVGAASLRLGADDPWPLVEPEPAVALHPERLEELDGLGCGECHASVVEQWSETSHAIAWKDEVYQEAIADRRNAGLCHSCHRPTPLVQGGELKRPKARDENPHLGVDCAACHLADDGALLGPRGASTDAHPTRTSELLTVPGSNALCSRCHATNIGPVIGIAKDFEQAKMADRGFSCVGCHMAPLPRLSETAPLVRSHRLQTPRDPAFLRLAFAPRLEEGRVVIANRAGHRVPGLIGRTITFTAEVIDVSGEIVRSAALTLDARAYLPVDGEVAIEIATGGGEVRLRGDHLDPRAPETLVRFLDEELE